MSPLPKPPLFSLVAFSFIGTDKGQVLGVLPKIALLHFRFLLSRKPLDIILRLYYSYLSKVQYITIFFVSLTRNTKLAGPGHV